MINEETLLQIFTHTWSICSVLWNIFIAHFTNNIFMLNHKYLLIITVALLLEYILGKHSDLILNPTLLCNICTLQRVQVKWWMCQTLSRASTNSSSEITSPHPAQTGSAVSEILSAWLIQNTLSPLRVKMIKINISNSKSYHHHNIESLCKSRDVLQMLQRKWSQWK